MGAAVHLPTRRRRRTAKNGPRNQKLETPWPFVLRLQDLLGREFDLDVAAEPHTAKAALHYTRGDDGLRQRWFGLTWCNPPYATILPWVLRALEHARAGTAWSWLLVPARLATPWYREVKWARRREQLCDVGELEYRIPFWGCASASPFEDSLLITFRRGVARDRRVRRVLDEMEVAA